jgi:hypothetical protein
VLEINLLAINIKILKNIEKILVKKIKRIKKKVQEKERHELIFFLKTNNALFYN